jgi:hypothetical protein
MALTMGLFISFGLGRRNEIMANWDKYRSDPRYAFTAFMYKPDNDTRSRLQFTSDNFSDVMSTMITDVFKIFLQPIFSVFHLFMSSLTQSMGSLLSMKGVLGTMWRDFSKILDIFMNRFAGTFYELRKTYAKLFNSMQRTFAIVTGSVFQGISAVNSILSMIDLMIKICIIILVVLVVMVIFFWFILWPSIPVILVIVGICVAAGFGGAVGGMASAFCFAETAHVAKSDGTQVAISQIQIGDELADGGRVTAVMEFEPMQNGFYSLFGIPVSGSHIVFNGNTPVQVKDHSSAIPASLPEGTRIFCLNTTNHRIPVVGTDDAIHTFSDWEELPSNDSDALLRWNRFVFETLNPGEIWQAPTAPEVLESEAVLHPTALVDTPNGPVHILSIRPGDTVLDENGNGTRVTGIVRMDRSEVKSYISFSFSHASSGVWMKIPESDDSKLWEQRYIEPSPHYDDETVWGSLITESGSFRLTGGQCIRDFTDVGADKIESTYSWVLNALSTE